MDPDYSRNRIVRSLFSDLGWTSAWYRPAVSRVGWLTAVGARLVKPDLVWVPCFRHTDVASAATWARRWEVPLVADPLISAYQKQVWERKKWPRQSAQAERKRVWESALLSKADRVVADTPSHADFFAEVLAVPRERIRVLYVGAEDGLFSPAPPPAPHPPFEVLFYGAFLELHGPLTIVEAARRTQDFPIRWVLLGQGSARKEAEKAARGLKNVVFEPWIDYARLPDRMARAHVVLGVFGDTLKGDLVIPNKVFQAMAMAKPVITRQAGAYAHTLARSGVIGWVPPADPVNLALRVTEWLRRPGRLASRGAAARRLYDAFFGPPKLQEMLGEIVGPERGKGG